MNPDLPIVWMLITFMGGIGLGAVFFGGLWLTTRSLRSVAANPALLILSFLLRVSIVLLGLFWMTGADWRYVLVCLAGFLLARSLVIRRVATSFSRHSTPAGGTPR